MPRAFRNSDEYYDDVERRAEENVWWKRVLRYVLSVSIFLLFIVLALAAYWTWVDYSPNGFREISVESWLGRAAFRWREFNAGRLEIGSPAPVLCYDASSCDTP